MYKTNPSIDFELKKKIVNSKEHLKDKITLFLIYLYGPFCILGNLAKFSEDESSLGISTIFLIAVVLLNLRIAFNVCFKNKIYFTIFLLVTWWCFTSIFSNNYPQAFGQLAQFILYLLFSAIIFKLNLNLSQIKKILLFYIIGSFITSTLTIIDFLNIIDIPRVNETFYGKETSLGTILQASGPFSRRSAMAAYFSISIPVCAFIIIWGKYKNTIINIFIFSTFILSIISLMITGNRAAILGSFISIIIILIFKSKSKLTLIKYFIFLSILLMLFILLLTIYFPDQIIVYKALFGIGDVDLYKADTQSESDQIRLLLFLHVIKSFLDNPIGHGFSNIYNFQDNNNADPHNIITQILWATGILGILWIAYFSNLVYLKIKNVYNQNFKYNESERIYLIILISGLFSWFICGMYHMILGMGIAWLFFGLLINSATKFQNSIKSRIANK